MLHVGLDLSRRRIDVCVIDDAGVLVKELVAYPDADGLRVLAGRFDARVRGVIESMTGARWVHDTLEALGWVVEMADAARVKALAPLTAKTDRIDARVLAELSYRDLIPAIWLPPPEVRGMRETARFRLHMVKHRSMLKNRIHAGLVTHGIPVGVSDLFGAAGRRTLENLELGSAWAESTQASLMVIDHLNEHIDTLNHQLRAAAGEHPDVELLVTAPGVGPVLGYTIASEIGDINRFPSPTKLVGYTGLCPRVHQSGDTDRRGPLTKHGPRWLRWALIEASIHAARHPAYAAKHQATVRRLGQQRGPKVARVQTARKLATAIWMMLTRRQPFAPGGSRPPLAA